MAIPGKWQPISVSRYGRHDHESLEDGNAGNPYLSVTLREIEPTSHIYGTASLACWLRRPPRDRKIPGSNPAGDGIFPGRVIPVT